MLSLCYLGVHLYLRLQASGSHQAAAEHSQTLQSNPGQEGGNQDDTPNAEVRELTGAQPHPAWWLMCVTT